MKTYRVRYARDDEGWWYASVPEVPGCHTQGRSLHQARNRIREALSLWVDDAESARFAEDIDLPQEARRAIARVRTAKDTAERERGRAAEATTRAARLLTGRLGLSVRDAAELLGLSHQRVQQLVQVTG